MVPRGPSARRPSGLKIMRTAMVSEPEPPISEHWKEEPEPGDFPAAQSYLSLLVGRAEAARLTAELAKKRPLRHHPAKDILRAAALPLLGPDDPEVKVDMEKVRAGRKLSPVLLVEGDPLWIADGYHRVCVSYHLGEKNLVPCRVATREMK